MGGLDLFFAFGSSVHHGKLLEILFAFLVCSHFCCVFNFSLVKKFLLLSILLGHEGHLELHRLLFDESQANFEAVEVVTGEAMELLIKRSVAHDLNKLDNRARRLEG